MELPFAVESPGAAVTLPRRISQSDNDDGSSSLESADSHGSLSPSEASYDPIRDGGVVVTAPNHHHHHHRHHPLASAYANTTSTCTTQQPQFVSALSAAGAVSAAAAAPVIPPSPYTFDATSNKGLESVLSQFGVISSSSFSATAPQLPLAPPSSPRHNQHRAVSSAGVPSSSLQQNQQQHQLLQQEQQQQDLIDFTYVTVCETDEDEVDILLPEGFGFGGDFSSPRDASYTTSSDGGGLMIENAPPSDILTLLLSSASTTSNTTSAPQPPQHASERLVFLTEQANQMAGIASREKKQGNLVPAVEAHTAAAKLYRDAALLLRDENASMANSFLMLSQTQAKAALALKRVVRLRHDATADESSSSTSSNKINNNSKSQQELLLRAKVRGALSKKPEEDISESAFLGRAGSANTNTTVAVAAATRGTSSSSSGTSATASNKDSNDSTASSAGGAKSHNPVDEMIELERELRNMDMAIEMGNSIASLDARTQHRLKTSIVEGSFMVVPPGSNSYLSSSHLWSHNAAPSPSRPALEPTMGTAGAASVRARANRVQNILEASHTRAPAAAMLHAQHHHTQHPHPAHPHQQVVNTNSTRPHTIATTNNTMESSWWGNSSQASQVLTSSVISLASTGVGGMMGDASPANTKQLLMHMDSFKTLRDENEALLKEVVGAKAARMEAKAAKEQMQRFREEYGKRFAALKEALEKFRKAHPESGSGGGDNDNNNNPVTSSEFARSAGASEQLARQDKLIKKLTADLKKEKEESKKKDAALRKYESFYREVKARSAQKAAQRQKETQQRQQQQHQQQVRQSARFPK